MASRQFSTQDVKRCCENKLDMEFSTTSKAFHGWYKKDEVKIRRISVPVGEHFMGKGLYRSMASQLGLTTDQFDDLLECSLEKDEYEEILKSQGML